MPQIKAEKIHSLQSSYLLIVSLYDRNKNLSQFYRATMNRNW